MSLRYFATGVSDVMIFETIDFRLITKTFDRFASFTISTCCLKTHQYGGVFTMSLKLHVAVVPTSRNGFGYMTELHGSSHQRKMIAEINAPFKPEILLYWME